MKFRSLLAGIALPALFAAASAAEPFMLREGNEWRKIRFDVTKIKEGSILDFSKVLNHHRPAGKYGFLKAVGDHFEFEKLPGVKQRFFGVNLSEVSTIPSKEDAPLLAESIARAGYNSVRLHHYDDYIVKKDGGTTTELDPEKIDRMDFLVKQLRDRGIYVTIDLYCSRVVSDQEIPEIYHPVSSWCYKNAVYIVDSARKNFLAFAKNLLTHKNPYTGLSYAEDPAFCFISVINENRFAEWDPKNAGALGWKWEALYVDWCRKKGISKERQADGGLRLRFIQDFQKQYFGEIRAALRDMGVKVPLTDQNNGVEPILSLTRRNYDYTDIHFYMGHPHFPNNNWRLPSTCEQKSFVELFPGGATGEIFPQRIYGRPYTVTELKWCKPLKARGEGGAIMGGIAGLQDYDALYTFQWAWGGKDYMKEACGAFFCLYGDPITYLSDRMIHLLFMRGDVSPSELKTTLVMPNDAAKLDPEADQLPGLGGEIGLVTQIGNSTSGAGSNFSWRFGSDASEATMLKKFKNSGLGRGLLDRENRHYVSSTGEVELDGRTNTYKVVSPRSEAMVFVNEGKLDGGVMSVENRTPYTTFFASAMDGKNLWESGRILFLHLNNAGHHNMTFTDETMTQMNSYGNLPHLVHHATGSVTLRLGGDGTPKVYALNLKGERIGEVKSEFADGALRFTADTAGINGEAVLAYEIAR